ncbi:hypothetical protein NDU88_001745 [Pleurodeles waltl]|uniref:Uncharacterized protein n=1 Tax=Pleurodeles waltl TaxID=8319 RepID=A0AAV7QB06_PLEWA|nr:hypothetical protein NDU88_001745 [Pleurodeles waltl]
MRTLNKVLRISILEARDPETSLHRFLREYPSTPHCTTGQAPWTLMFSSVRRDVLLTPPEWQPAPFQRELGRYQRRRRNERASQKRGATGRRLHGGDKVILKDCKPGWKFCMPYEPGVWTVSQVRRTMITAIKGHEEVTRNILSPMSQRGSPTWMSLGGHLINAAPPLPSVKVRAPTSLQESRIRRDPR